MQPVPTLWALPPCPHEAELAAAQAKIAELEADLRAVRCIGTAVGIVMASYKINDEAAYYLLVHASQQSHRELRDVAEQVVETGALNWKAPDSPTATRPATLRRVPEPGSGATR